MQLFFGNFEFGRSGDKTFFSPIITGGHSTTNFLGGSNKHKCTVILMNFPNTKALHLGLVSYNDPWNSRKTKFPSLTIYKECNC